MSFALIKTRKRICLRWVLEGRYSMQGRSWGGGGGGGVFRPPLPPRERKVHWKVRKGPQNVQKGPLECTRRSSITVCLINDAAYYTDIDLDTVENLNKFCYEIFFCDQLGHTCSNIIQRKVHFFCMQKNLPAELPGYNLGYVSCYVGVPPKCGYNPFQLTWNI